MSAHVNLTPSESEWINTFDAPQAPQVLLRFARAVNILDADWLEDCLAEDVSYTSQSVFDELTGADEVLGYWSGKFDTLRESEGVRVVAELGFIGASQPCVVLCQRRSRIDRSWLSEPVGLVTADVDESGLAQSLTMITVAPSPSSAGRTGIFPGVTPPTSETEAGLSRAAADYREITVDIFYLNGEIPWDRAMAGAIPELHALLPGVVVNEYGTVDADWDDRGAEACGAYGFKGFPSVGASFRGEVFYRHSGGVHSQDIVAAIKDAVG